MSTYQPDTILADMLAFDEDGSPVVFVEVKGMTPVPESVLQLLETLRSNIPPIPFGILADPDRLQFFREGGMTPDPIFILKTRELAHAYGPSGEDDTPLYETYLTGLIDAWLSDLAFHWKHAVPPANEQMKSLGIAALLAGGTIEREVYLACARLYRD